MEDDNSESDSGGDCNKGYSIIMELLSMAIPMVVIGALYNDCGHVTYFLLIGGGLMLGLTLLLILCVCCCIDDDVLFRCCCIVGY